jgi:hypothetical protein
MLLIAVDGLRSEMLPSSLLAGQLPGFSNLLGEKQPPAIYCRVVNWSDGFD